MEKCIPNFLGSELFAQWFIHVSETLDQFIMENVIFLLSTAIHHGSLALAKSPHLPLPRPPPHAAMATAAMAAAASSRAFLRPHRLLLIPHTHPLRRRLSATAAPFSTAASASVVDVLRERGLVEATTSEALAAARPGELKVYCGFDPTAESLHLGNLLGLVALSWFRRCGHTTVALIGGATGRVGDPSGKSAERPELDVAAVEANSDAIKSLVAQILGRIPEPAHAHDSQPVKNDQPLVNSGSATMGSFVILDNYDWWKDITLLDFLKEVGRFARVGTMIAKESVKKRLSSEDGMSYTEFTYQLLQGYDFLYMFKNMGVNVQIGGSDQWGNITAGTELIRKILQVEGAHGLTFPLLLKSDGTKFGKTEDGAIWLSSKMLSPYKFYQYFFAVPDVDVIRFMKILTFLSLDEIQELEESMKKPGYVPNTVQKKLAEEVTRFVHGEEGLAEALKATEALRPGAQTQLDAQTIEGIADDILRREEATVSRFVPLSYTPPRYLHLLADKESSGATIPHVWFVRSFPVGSNSPCVYFTSLSGALGYLLAFIVHLPGSLSPPMAKRRSRFSFGCFGGQARAEKMAEVVGDGFCPYDGYPVKLHIYDLSQGMARQLSATILGKAIEGIWHTGVVVYGREYYFGGGIQQGQPGRTPYGTPVRAVDLGVTHVPREMFEDFLREIGPRYTPATYNLLTHNCNNFSNEAAQFLAGTTVPSFILELPKEVMNSPVGALICFPRSPRATWPHRRGASGSASSAHRPPAHAASCAGFTTPGTRAAPRCTSTATASYRTAPPPPVAAAASAPRRSPRTVPDERNSSKLPRSPGEAAASEAGAGAGGAASLAFRFLASGPGAGTSMPGTQLGGQTVVGGVDEMEVWRPPLDFNAVNAHASSATMSSVLRANESSERPRMPFRPEGRTRTHL
nr:unnamed protein product [Digitaria exilis]